MAHLLDDDDNANELGRLRLDAATSKRRLMEVIDPRLNVVPRVRTLTREQVLSKDVHSKGWPCVRCKMDPIIGPRWICEPCEAIWDPYAHEYKQSLRYNYCGKCKEKDERMHTTPHVTLAGKTVLCCRTGKSDHALTELILIDHYDDYPYLFPEPYSVLDVVFERPLSLAQQQQKQAELDTMLADKERAEALVQEETEATEMRMGMLAQALQMDAHYDANLAAWEAKQRAAGEKNLLHMGARGMRSKRVSIHTATLCC